MQSAILSLAVAVNLVSAAGLRPRQDASEAASDFTSAADALISAYIPAPQWEALTSAAGSAANAAGVTADVKDVIYSALRATEAPEWFENAVPTEWSSQYAALESAIESLRPVVVTVTAPSAVPTVIAVTTTDAEGNTVTQSISTNLVPVPTTITTDVLTSPSVTLSVITGTDSAGSAFTSTLAEETGSEASESATSTATVTEATTTESATVTESGEATGTEETGTEATGADATGTGADATGTEAPEANGAATFTMANSLVGVAAVFALFMAI